MSTKFVTKEIPVGSILPNPNWRRNHTTTSGLIGIESWYGKENPEDLIRIRPITEKDKDYKADQQLYYNIAGHNRLDLWKDLGHTAILARVYSELTPEEEEAILRDKPAKSLEKAEVYRALWRELYEGKKSSKVAGLDEWMLAIHKIGVGNVTLMSAPKSGKLEATPAEQKQITAMRSNGKGLSLSECTLRVFLRTRWTGLKQSIDALAGVNETVAAFFGYGLHTRQKKFLKDLPGSAVKANWKKSKDAKDYTFSSTIDFNDPNLQELAEVGKIEYGKRHEEDDAFFVMPEKPGTEPKAVTANAVAEAMELAESVNSKEFLEYILNENSEDEIVTALAMTEDGKAIIEGYLEAIGPAGELNPNPQN